MLNSLWPLSAELKRSAPATDCTGIVLAEIRKVGCHWAYSIFIIMHFRDVQAYSDFSHIYIKKYKKNSASWHIFKAKERSALSQVCDTLNSSHDMLSSLLGIYSVFVAFHYVDIACVTSVSTEQVVFVFMLCSLNFGPQVLLSALMYGLAECDVIT